MAAIPLSIENSNLSMWLPTPEEVINKCRENGPSPGSFTIHEPDGPDLAFIKYGCLQTMGEARTQDYIANIVNSDKNVVVLVPRVYYAFRHDGMGYIVMEHVGDSDCDEDDLPAITLAIKRLRDIPSPTTSPGPVGGGPIIHRFFSDHRSSVQYNTVEDLQNHINKILAKAGHKLRVDFAEEENGNLSLCLDDIHQHNFRKDKSGRIFAIDFAKNNFLPYAFQDFAFEYGHALACEVRESLNFPSSKFYARVFIASGQLQLYNDSSYALPRSLRESIGTCDLFA